MKKFFQKTLFVSLIFSFFVPQNFNAYDFKSEAHEGTVKGIREEIYDLYRLYEDILYSKNNDIEIFGYNGVCENVTVGGQVVPLEDYVAGVVNAEMGCDESKFEAMKAQAIAARSFLIGSKLNSSSCNVGSSQGFQVFRAVDKNSSTGQLCLKAAQETDHLVVVRNEEVAVTSYQSYPASQWYTKDDSSGWSILFQRWADDSSSTWTWNGPPRSTVFGTPGVFGTSLGTYNDHHWGMSQTLAMYLDIGENYKYDEIIELFYDEPIRKLSLGTDNYKYLDSSFGKIAYFNQNNYPNDYYSSDVTKHEYKGSSGAWATIKSHGCGPTAAAIVATSMGRQTSPIEMTETICKNGGCTNGGTINEVIARTLKNNYGLDIEMTTSGSKVLDALKTGNALVIALMGPGQFTTNGHYIVLTGMTKDGKVSVADPNRVANNTNFSFYDVVHKQISGRYTIIRRS